MGSKITGAIAVAAPFDLTGGEQHKALPVFNKSMKETSNKEFIHPDNPKYKFDAFPAPTWRCYWTPRPKISFPPWTEPHGMIITGKGIEDDEAEIEIARKLASPIYHVGKSKPPILILASESDLSAPAEGAVAMRDEMRRIGQICELELWEMEGHMQITDIVVQRSLQFLEDHFHVFSQASR